MHRYTMPKREIVEAALWAFRQGYGSLMLQSGELATEKRLSFALDVVREVRVITKAEERKKNGLSDSALVKVALLAC